MNGKKRQKTRTVRSAKECAYIAVFVALTIATQLAFSAVPGVELVTLLFVSYAFSFGIRRGMAAATAFSLLRQLVFGFYPTVLVLYLVYYNMLASVFGWLGQKPKGPMKRLVLVVVCACVCTVLFTLLDNVLTPLWYGYSAKAAKAYFYASIPFVLPQTACVGISTALLFLPLERTFRLIKRTL
ncbi:MAG: hypothetical protein IJX91_05260 [Clostridia bacterium]|nr:hypothetical protein [Clostridia bacterium]